MGREKGTAETPEEILNKYKEVVRYLKIKKSHRDSASSSDVSLETVQKVKRAMELA